MSSTPRGWPECTLPRRVICSDLAACPPHVALEAFSPLTRHTVRAGSDELSWVLMTQKLGAPSSNFPGTTWSHCPHSPEVARHPIYALIST